MMQERTTRGVINGTRSNRDHGRSKEKKNALIRLVAV